VIFAALLALIIVAATLLLRTEWQRYRVDRSPGKPPKLEEAALDRWNARVVVLVAAMSVMGALLAWWASATFAGAEELDQRALQQTNQYQTTKAIEESKIAFGAGLTQIYEQHTVAESNLYTQAAAAWNQGDRALALALEAEARVEGAQERVLDPGFLYYSPSSPGSGGAVPYSVAEQETNALFGNQDLRTLDPAHVARVEADAASTRARGETIVLGTVLIFVGVFFFTLAYLGGRHRRVRAFVPGILGVVGALAVVVVATLT
jgi:hypothetical protein